MGLSANRQVPDFEVWDQHGFVLKNAAEAYLGGLAAIDTVTGGVVCPPAVGAGFILIGYFAERKTGDATVKVNVKLIRPVTITWMNNTDTGHEVASTDLGKVCYLKDDLTVSMNSGSSASKAGRVWGIATINGVACAAVELFAPAVGDS